MDFLNILAIILVLGALGFAAWAYYQLYQFRHKQGELKIMANYIVKDDNPDVGFTVTVGDVTDSEGNVIIDAGEVTVAAESSDENVIAVTFDAAAKTGSVKFGSPGNAAFTVTATGADGKVLATGGDNFTVTTGDPAAITSIATAFDGLTPTA